MSGKVMGWVWDQDLPQNQKFVLLAYADHADHEGYNVFPSVDLIARKTGYSRRSVQRIVNKLKDKLYLLPDGVGSKGTNKYIIPVPVGGDKMTPPPVEGGDTAVAQGGDTAASPEPSVNRHDKQKNPPTPRKKAHLTADEILTTIIIPDNFHHHSDFAPTWYAFLEHRVEIKKPMTMRGAEMMLKKLNKYGADIAIAALQDSVANGWQGVFPEKHANQRSAQHKTRSAQSREDMDDYLRRDLEKNLIGGTHER